MKNWDETKMSLPKHENQGHWCSLNFLEVVETAEALEAESKPPAKLRTGLLVPGESARV
jgi:hypothetical protein